MSESQLRSVKDFVIENEFAKIEFDLPVDLRNLNLDKIVVLKHKIVEVYPETRYTDSERPMRI